MDCKSVREKILDYIEGDVSFLSRKEMEEHFSLCALCRKEYEGYEKSWQALDSWGEIEPDPLHNARFWEAVRASEKKGDFLSGLYFLFSRKVYALACVVLLLAGIFVYVGINSRTSDIFDEPYYSWQPVRMNKLIGYAAHIVDRNLVALASPKGAFSLPAYVEHDESDDQLYPEIEIGEGEMRIMDGAHDVVDSMFF